MWSSVKLIAMLAVSLRACKLEQVKIKLLYLLISRFSRSYASWRGWDPERCAYLLRKPSQTGFFFFFLMFNVLQRWRPRDTGGGSRRVLTCQGAGSVPAEAKRSEVSLKNRVCITGL